ncbi:hypothetical protein F4818DRAFT_403558 [Hypoxylon cercidicola]|nr:hypothetical protein F4818DRAFT_403558 [Hypoxylon cercidicola]
MERFPRSPEEASKLLKLSDQLREAALTVQGEWAKEDFSGPVTGEGQDTARILPSHKLWEAEKTIEAISGSLVELVSEPYQRVQQILTQFMESRALFIAAERNIPDLLAEAGDDGLEIKVLAEKTSIESKKLGKITASPEPSSFPSTPLVLFVSCSRLTTVLSANRASLKGAMLHPRVRRDC